ncbi:TetR/AcrR family transcriptional regulator [Rhizobium sp. C4]|uniref:TetR/AcrR family transcriptional regulator n=1 Tax=Rhizobium sp. C4 TaxID=1349800 RepID=UPI001E39E0A5|nr:TetR/AcrR family transcriptional regulator [Rhizobium sp. C4]MCD2172797.1 TetR family transcriptional regulator [Rhizobium sp. C4]
MKRPPRTLRRQPRQDRSRERVDQILVAAQKLIGEKGLAALTMVDIASSSSMPLASVYHYFPNRTAVMAELYRLFSDRFQHELKNILSSIDSAQDIRRATDAITDRYFEMLKGEPAIQDLLNAVQADKEMLNLDIAQTRAQASAFSARTVHLIAEHHRENFKRSVYLIFQLAGGAMRLALFQGGEDGERIVADFKRLIKAQLSEFELE